MYSPPLFRQSNVNKMHSFIEEHAFSTVLSQGESQPTVSHLPLLLDRDAGPHGALRGHMSRAKPHWQTFDGQPAVAIFHGPHAHISSAWYGTKHAVPTWNYVVVHASGTGQLIDTAEAAVEIAQRTLDVFEAGESDRPSDAFVAGLLSQIVPFRIEIKELEGMWKLSQNHTVSRRKRVVRKLQKSSDANSQPNAELMENAITERP